MVFLGLFTGFLLGLVLRGAGFTRPEAIQDMLTLRDLYLVKVLLSGAATAALAVYFTTDLAFLRPFVKPLHLGVLIGGVLFGAGLAAAGYCPGTAFTAIGEGNMHGWVVLLSALAGTLVYAAIYPWVSSLLSFSTGEQVTLYSLLDLPRAVVAAAAGLGFWTLCVILSIAEKRMDS